MLERLQMDGTRLWGLSPSPRVDVANQSWPSFPQSQSEVSPSSTTTCCWLMNYLLVGSCRQQEDSEEF